MRRASLSSRRGAPVPVASAIIPSLLHPCSVIAPLPACGLRCVVLRVECNGLQSVEVTPTESGIELVLMTGVPAGAEDDMCSAIAQLYRTDVTLDAPLIGGTFSE